MDSDLPRVSSISDASVSADQTMLNWHAIGLGGVFGTSKLIQVFASIAFKAGLHQASNTYLVSNLEAFDILSNLKIVEVLSQIPEKQFS